jgi:hypothetical protein
MSNWIRNNAGELVKREIVGWGRHLVTITTSPAERSLHAIERRNGYERVAACGAPCPNGFKDHVAAPADGESRRRRCEGIALDLFGVPAA